MVQARIGFWRLHGKRREEAGRGGGIASGVGLPWMDHGCGGSGADRRLCVKVRLSPSEENRPNARSVSRLYSLK